MLPQPVDTAAGLRLGVGRTTGFGSAFVHTEMGMNGDHKAQTCREVTRFQQPADNPGWRQWAKLAAHFASLWVHGLEHLIGWFEQHT